MSAFIHPTAVVEKNVRIGDDTSIWDNVHIRRDTVIGQKCIIGEKSHISYDVKIGNLVKIDAFVYISTGVTIEDGVMIGPGCIFANDRYSRATNPDLKSLRGSRPDQHTFLTLVRSGATIGAGAVIGSSLTIGRFAMVGIGSVVTSSIANFHLVVGNPARIVGFVCRCGEPIGKPDEQSVAAILSACLICGREYAVDGGQVTEVEAT